MRRDISVMGTSLREGGVRQTRAHLRIQVHRASVSERVEEEGKGPS